MRERGERGDEGERGKRDDEGERGKRDDEGERGKRDDEGERGRKRRIGGWRANLQVSIIAFSPSHMELSAIILACSVTS